MMLETVFADDTGEGPWRVRDLDHRRAAKVVSGVRGEPSFAHVSRGILPVTSLVVKRARAHRAGLHAAHAGPEGVQLADGAGDDFLVVMRTCSKKSLGRLLQWKQTALFGSSP